MALNPRFLDTQKPLVSILIFNYNYGRYLAQCLDSVLAQSYDNVEICFSDNCSTDESWEIALEYVRRHPNSITITRNRENFGVYANIRNCLTNIRGTYFIQLCSDDYLHPDYVRRCVEALEENPGTAFAITNRTIVNEHDELLAEPPFYDTSCVIPGEEQAAVYMMAGVNPSVSQVMYRHSCWRGITTERLLASRWYAQRIHDFALTCEYDIIYLTDALLYHRLHLANDSFGAASNLMEVVGPYVMQHQFADTAIHRNMEKVVARLPESIHKLGLLCLRYAARSILADNLRDATRYFHLAVAMDPNVRQEPEFALIEKYWKADPTTQRQTVAELKDKSNFVTRTVSYPPPPGSRPIAKKAEARR
jgi:glycosyltransferase involved in cell wall biosynthesis